MARLSALPKGKRTRAEVLDHAAKLFVERGVAGTSLQEIAEAAGITRPALYYHFDSKDAVLRALVSESTEEVARDLWVAEASDLSVARRLETCSKLLVCWILDNPTRFIVADRNERELPAALAERHAEGKRRVIEVFDKLVRAGVTEGVFHPVDVRVAALTIIGMCTWTAWWFRESGRLPRDAVAQEVSRLALAAVSSNAARVERDEIAGSLRTIRRELDRLENRTAPGGDPTSN